MDDVIKESLDREVIRSLVEEHRQSRKVLEQRVGEAQQKMHEVRQLLKENALAEKILSELEE